MKIDSTQISLASEHTAVLRDEHSEHVAAWKGREPSEVKSASLYIGTQITISEAARLALTTDGETLPDEISSTSVGKPPDAPQNAEHPQPNADAPASAIDAALRDADLGPGLNLIRRLLEKLTGRSVKIFSSADLPAGSAAARLFSGETMMQGAVDQSSWGAVYTRSDVHEESESMRFSAEGTVRTADGREISVKLDLRMASSLRQESSDFQRLGSATRDPLVIDFAGSAPQLLDQHFRFDLNSDGAKEELPLLGSGSAYLAFDRNGNGQVDSGSELFGPASNNGFSELAKLDTDGNGWIDDADPDFKRLSVWRPQAGEDVPGWQSLADTGVGALGLAHLSTSMALHGSNASRLGNIRESGFALGENGQALAIHEIDLVVR